jgi:hypothetical protein
MDLKQASLIFKQLAQAKRAERSRVENECIAAEQLAEAADIIDGKKTIVEQAHNDVAAAKEQLASVKNQIAALAAEAQKQQSVAAKASAESGGPSRGARSAAR